MFDRPPSESSGKRRPAALAALAALAARVSALRPPPPFRVGLALLALLLLLELPSFVMLERWRPTGEVSLLLSAFVASSWLRPRLRALVRALLAVCTALFLVMQIDRAVFLRFMGEEPLFYDQLFMLRHLFVLFSDVMNARVLLLMLAVGAGIAFFVWLVRRLLRVITQAVGAAPNGIALALLAGVLCGVFVSAKLPRAEPLVRFVTPALFDNIKSSYAIYRGVQQQLSASPYRSYAGITLKRKPDVYLVFVESYGRLLLQKWYLSRGWHRELERMQQSLGEHGWSAVSGFSQAPVMGGRSWLAEGSVLMGMHVPYEAVFHHLVNQIENVPNIVSFLAAQGYHTVLLAPSDRERPGVENVNYYHHQRVVRFTDLAYRGPRVGWGMVPDQYSLGYTDAHVLRDTPRPLYFEFHMVTSHAPWDDVPELVDDYETLNQNGSNDFADPVGNSVWTRLSRYQHARRFPYYGELKRGVGRRYAAAIGYEFGVLSRYLEQLPGDALVIVIGDHQPPLLAAETRDFDTPIHVLSHDPAMLAEFRDKGFSDGLLLEGNRKTTLRHESLFSLLARALVRCCADSQELPGYKRYGVRVGH